jgi:solute carrier family 66 (lysosomal lysine-arginine transporter), member 1
MDTSLWHSLSGPSLPNHCEPTSEFLIFLSSRLQICIPTSLSFVSSLLGTLSIVSWLFAQLPQIYKNYTLQSTAGLSAFFLVEWCLGDTANLLGAILTRQAGWQVTIAFYYVFVDVVLVFQYYWYTPLRARRRGKQGTLNADYPTGTGSVIDGVSPYDADSIRSSSPRPITSGESKDFIRHKGLSFGTPESRSLSYSNEKHSSSIRTSYHLGGNSSSRLASPKAILFTSMLCAVLANASPTTAESVIRQSGPKGTPIEIAGRILSWMSTVLYLGSRLPQLYKNYRRKSTAGLSPLLFMAAFGGNLFYSSSLLTNPNAWNDYPAYGGGGWVGGEGNNRLEWVGRAMPFFLGAAGVLSLDAFMGVQFMLYGDQGGDPVVRVADPAHCGRRRWRRVTGWMRGWVPSGERYGAPSLNRERFFSFLGSSTPPIDENRRPLLDQGCNSYGAV